MALPISSRYYETFEMLKWHIKDSSIENLRVLVEDFRCTIESDNICTTIQNRIDKFIQRNLFSKDETRLLIKNLLPCLKTIGGHQVKTVSSRIELINKLGKNKENQSLINEYEKLISTIEEIQLTIKQHLTDKYLTSTITGFKTSLSEPQQIELYKAVNGNYIECSEADFLMMFTDTPKPIRWKKSNALLSFFIYDFFRGEKNYWDIAQKIFINHKTKKYYSSLRQSYTTAFNGQDQEPKGYHILLSSYKHLL